VKITSPSSGTVTTVGVTISLQASFTGPRTNDTHSAIASWGDGTSTACTVTESGGSGKCTASHKYTQTGTYTVTVTVTDDNGGATTSPGVTVTVR
jgi:hypothetical protein